MPPRRRSADSSVESLLEAAERLIGRHGLEGVSLRQIGAAAGSANNYAVQYHFGDMAGLIREILSRRMAEVNEEQAHILKQLQKDGQDGNIRLLVDAFLRPLLRPVDRQGERIYARFIIALLNSQEGRDYFLDLFPLAPAAMEIQQLILDSSSDLPPPLLIERLRLAAIMVLSSVFNHSPPALLLYGDSLIDDALDIATAALTAPVRITARETADISR